MQQDTIQVIIGLHTRNKHTINFPGVGVRCGMGEGLYLHV